MTPGLICQSLLVFRGSDLSQEPGIKKCLLTGHRQLTQPGNMRVAASHGTGETQADHTCQRR